MSPRPLALLALAALTSACGGPLLFVAPAATPSYVAGTSGQHTFSVATRNAPPAVLCDMAAVPDVCVAGVGPAIDTALPTALATRLRSAAGAPEYLARFEPMHLGVHRNEYSNRISPTIEWRFVLAIPGRATVVQLEETSGLPADGPRAITVDELPGALRTIENGILARITAAVDQYFANVPRA